MEKQEMRRGDHICVKHRRLGDLVTHHGIYCGDSTVIHFDGNDKLIRRDSLENFCHPFPVSEIVVFKQCAPNNVHSVLGRAEACLGKSGYSLFGNNCEHFATFCITNEWKSYQADLLDNETIKFLKLIKENSNRFAQLANKAADTQQDPAMKVLAATGVIVGSVAAGVVMGTGSYSVRKISQMRQLRKSRSAQKKSATQSSEVNQAAQRYDLRLDLKLAFREAALGGEKDIKINHLKQCQACMGTGFRKKKLTRSKVSCSSCNGEGQIQKTKFLKISIPAGADTGTVLRVSGEGDAERFEGSVGDLYVYLFVHEDEELEREGTSILSTIEISQAQADSGCNLNINTLDCSGSLKIPPGTKNGAVLRLNGRGVPHLGNPSERGDHLVTISVK